jgi:PTS system fructose-specific IIC component
VAIALLIPEKLLSDLHVEYLARISTALMDPKFTKILLNGTKAQIVSAVNDALKVNDTTLSLTKSNVSNAKVANAKGSIVGISACATGVAHTYMAREALEKHAKDVGYDV